MEQLEHQHATAMAGLAAQVSHLATEVSKLGDKFDKFKGEDAAKIDANAELRTRVWFLEKVVYGTTAVVLVQALAMLALGLTWVIAVAMRAAAK